MSTTLLENAESSQETEIEQSEWALERARNGAAWLDSRFGPDWDQCIDLETLDIGTYKYCILGQLHRQGYPRTMYVRKAIQKGFSRGLLDSLTMLFPFGPFKRAYRPLNEAWKAVLRERWNKKPAQTQPPGGNSSQRRDWNQAA
jgi:hypothetical protein